MAKQHVSRALRQRVAAVARNRCAYCHTAERVVGPFMEIDHIVPESAGGETVEHNLTLACPLCNSRKSDRMQALDPETGERTPLFHPNEQIWSEHFAWAEGGAVIVGQTPIGRCTVAALDMNHPDIVATRRLWITVGWHPPLDDL
jgi:hypothetical protein